MEGIVTQSIAFPEGDVARYIYGQRDENLKLLGRALDVTIGARGPQVTISGSAQDVKLAGEVLRQLYVLGEHGHAIVGADVRRALDILAADTGVSLHDIYSDRIFVAEHTNKVITPRSIAQKNYVDAIRKNDFVFGIGPAGTGKTYLAMAMALAAYLEKSVHRIILTRPAVEAGERLGFLPGDLAEKVNPYLRPLYDALHDMVDDDRAERMIERGIVEVAPLAFMRGRTLSNAFIIFDEAQNATTEQMKMFLTRMGLSSKAVITGDITQIDLPTRNRSGLVQANRILHGIDGIAFCTFTESDVVRHPLVQKVIQAYERAEATARVDRETT